MKTYKAYVRVNDNPDGQGSYSVVVEAAISTQVWSKDIAEFFASVINEALRERKLVL